jgi:hypothetical protein
VRVVHVPILVSAVAAGTLASGCGSGGGGETAATTTTRVATPMVVTAKLSGSQAIPKGPAAASGTATITLKPRSGRACWRIAVSGIDTPLSAHVHAARPGKLGVVVIPLGDRFSPTGCVLTGSRILRAVAHSPGSYYVDVHTTKHLQGAVRGQLQSAP